MEERVPHAALLLGLQLANQNNNNNGACLAVPPNASTVVVYQHVAEVNLLNGTRAKAPLSIIKKIGWSEMHMQKMLSKSDPTSSSPIQSVALQHFIPCDSFYLSDGLHSNQSLHGSLLSL